MKVVWPVAFMTGAFVCLIALPANAGENISYSYDALGRLVKTASSGTVNNNQTHSICYDKAGNRTTYMSDSSGSSASCDPGSIPAAFTIGSVSAVEGGVLTFVITRSGELSTAVGVSYATGNGSAHAGSDYVTTSGTLSFASNETNKTVTVSTVDDSAREGNETMQVTLSNPVGNASIAIDVATGTITDNDGVWSAYLTAGSSPGFIKFRGYCQSPAFGSLSDTAYSGKVVYCIKSLSGAKYFQLSSTSTPPNSGWTSISIPGVGTLNRMDATYSVKSSTIAEWKWSVSGTVVSGEVTIDQIQ